MGSRQGHIANQVLAILIKLINIVSSGFFSVVLSIDTLHRYYACSNSFNVRALGFLCLKPSSQKGMWLWLSGRDTSRSCTDIITTASKLKFLCFCRLFVIWGSFRALLTCLPNSLINNSWLLNWRCSLGPHFTPNWVPILNLFGSLLHLGPTSWEKCIAPYILLIFCFGRLMSKGPPSSRRNFHTRWDFTQISQWSSHFIIFLKRCVEESRSGCW